MEDDKPFVCGFAGCGQRFANSDHLNVHQQKHQLTISIGAKSGENLVDQTPTPTRFLKGDVDSDLFGEDLPDTNPFDQDFSKAVRKNSDSLTLTPVSSSVTASPSTPGATFLFSPSIKKPNGPRVKFTGAQKRNKPLSTTPILLPVAKPDNDLKNDSSSAIIVVSESSLPLSTNGLSGNTTIKTVTASTRPSIAAIIADPNSKFFQAMPVRGNKIINTSSAMLSVPTPAIVTSTRVIQNDTSTTGSIGLTKQVRSLEKLKEALEQHSRVSVAAPSPLSVSQHTVSGAFNGMKSNGLNELEIDSGSASPGSAAPSPEGQDSSKHGPAKRSRRNQEEVDPDERRKKFLERNRAAASRCRQKRKIWVQQLERKADELSLQNGQLQNEIAQLRTEVAQLKALLLTHKDCPVTMQQQKAIIDQMNPKT